MDNNTEDFFLNLKLPTHLPNEKPKLEQLPSSLPSKPPLSLPPIPKINNHIKSPLLKKQSPQQQKKPLQIKKDTEEEDEDIEEEESYEEGSKSNLPVPILGTSIILNTDEEIAKWIEERKKNWPSKKRMEEKKLETDRKRPMDDDTSLQQSKRAKRYCKFFIRGNCRNENCPNVHEIPVRALPNNKLVYHHGVAINVPERYSKSVNFGKSLHNLVVEHDHYKFENDKILQIIAKLVDNGLVKPNYDLYNDK